MSEEINALCMQKFAHIDHSLERFSDKADESMKRLADIETAIAVLTTKIEAAANGKNKNFFDSKTFMIMLVLSIGGSAPYAEKLILKLLGG